MSNSENFNIDSDYLATSMCEGKGPMEKTGIKKKTKEGKLLSFRLIKE